MEQPYELVVGNAFGANEEAKSLDNGRGGTSAMSARLIRSPITPPPQSELEAMLRLGCAFEERLEGLVLIYPEGATRKTINEHEGRYTVCFIHQDEQRQVTELYNQFTRTYIIVLRPARQGF